MSQAFDKDDPKLRACWSNLLDALPRFSEKAAKLYAQCNWTWIMDGGIERIPDAKDLESLAYSLAWEAYRSAPNGVSSGRLMVAFRQNQAGEWQGTVSVVPHWETVGEQP